MADRKFADRAVYKVLIDAPIDTVWSELIKTSSPWSLSLARFLRWTRRTASSTVFA